MTEHVRAAVRRRQGSRSYGMSQPSSPTGHCSFSSWRQPPQQDGRERGARRTPRARIGMFRWFLRTRLFRATAWTVITALLTLDVPWRLLQRHGGEALAQSTVVFGPENFVRANGAPQTVTRTFTVTDPSGAATLCVANGGTTNQYARVSSATGTLNNSQVLHPSDFNQQVAAVTRAVTLQSTNTLRVEVRSAPGSGVTLSIVRGTSANCPGAVTNRPPVANAGPAQTKPVTSLVTLDGSGSSDPDGNALTYLWSFVSTPAASLATLSSPTAVRPTFTIDQAGSYVLQLLVHDGQVNSAPAQVVISTSNTPPVAHAGPDQSWPVGTVVSLTGAGSTDIDGDALTYQWAMVDKPASSTAALANATSLTPSFSLDAVGEYVVQLIVHDGTANSVADTVTISTLNSRPVANAGPDQSAPVTTLVTLEGSGSTDVDGDVLSYSWSLVSQPSGSTTSLTNPTSSTPTLRIDRAGEYVVQLVVSDGTDSSPPDTVTISTLNSNPVANAGADQSGTVGTVIHLDGSNSSDVDGDLLTYQWSLTSKPTGSTAVLQNPTTATPQFTLDTPGSYIVQLLVHDGTVDSAPVTVTVSTLNSKPVAHAGADQSSPVGATVTLNGSASSDVDGDLLTYQWSLTSKPTGSTATLSDPSAVQPTFVIDRPGTYTAQLMVHDGTVSSEPATVTISTVNSQPVANPGPDQHGAVGATITLTGSGSSDVDGDPLTYQWSLTSPPATSTATLQNSTTVSTSFVLDKAGTYTAQLIVNDGTVDSDPVTVTITTLNSKPVANAGVDQNTLTGQTVTLTGNGSSDIDGNPLTYFWSLSAVPPGSTAHLLGETSLTPSFVADLAGTYVVQLIVHDGHLDSDPDTATIIVTQPDTTPPPPANLGNITLSPIIGGQVTLTGSANSV